MPTGPGGGDPYKSIVVFLLITEDHKERVYFWEIVSQYVGKIKGGISV